MILFSLYLANMKTGLKLNYFCYCVLQNWISNKKKISTQRPKKVRSGLRKIYARDVFFHQKMTSGKYYPKNIKCNTVTDVMKSA